MIPPSLATTLENYLNNVKLLDIEVVADRRQDTRKRRGEVQRAAIDAERGERRRVATERMVDVEGGEGADLERVAGGVVAGERDAAGEVGAGQEVDAVGVLASRRRSCRGCPPRR